MAYSEKYVLKNKDKVNVQGKKKNSDLLEVGAKVQMVNFRTTSEIYSLFTAINKKRGMSASSVLSGLVTDYIREYRHILDEDQD